MHACSCVLLGHILNQSVNCTALVNADQHGTKLLHFITKVIQ